MLRNYPTFHVTCIFVHIVAVGAIKRIGYVVAKHVQVMDVDEKEQ